MSLSALPVVIAGIYFFYSADVEQ